MEAELRFACAVFEGAGIGIVVVGQRVFVPVFVVVAMEDGWTGNSGAGERDVSF